MTINRTKVVKQPTATATDTVSLKSSSVTKLNNKKAKKYCLFYNRFGRCSRGDSCTFIHDPKRIALCPRLTLTLFINIYIKSRLSYETLI